MCMSACVRVVALHRHCLTATVECRSLLSAVGSVVCGRQPAMSADVKYWSVVSCAGASRGMRSTYSSRLQKTCLN